MVTNTSTPRLRRLRLQPRARPEAWAGRCTTGGTVDTSAWARAHHSSVRRRWQDALLADRLRVSPVVKLEILWSARDGGQFDSLAAELAALRPARLTAGVLRAAERGMAALAQRSAGTHRIPIVDYLVAAAAEEEGARVLHYDRDYDALAEVMAFESVWLAPPGSLP